MVHAVGEVLKWYLILSCSSHRNSGSRNIMNRCGLRVSSCIVPRLILIGGVVSKWVPVKDVVEWLYMLPTISTASKG